MARQYRYLVPELCEQQVIRDIREGVISPIIYNNRIAFDIRWMGFVIPDDGSESYQRIAEAVKFFGARWAEAEALYRAREWYRGSAR